MNSDNDNVQNELKRKMLILPKCISEVMKSTIINHFVIMIKRVHLNFQKLYAAELPNEPSSVINQIKKLYGSAEFVL